MSNLKLLRKILRLKSMKVTDFCFKNRDTELHLAVKPYTLSDMWATRPDCAPDDRAAPVGGSGPHGPALAVCPEGDSVSDARPGAGGDPLGTGLTDLLPGVAHLHPVRHDPEAAAESAVPTSTLSNLLHRVITRVRHGHTIRGLITLGVARSPPARAAARLRPGPRACPVGRPGHRDTIDRIFNDGLPTRQNARVAGHCDMSPAYIDRTTAPMSRWSSMTQAVDEVRKEQSALDTQGRKAIKGLRWLLSMHSKKEADSRTEPAPGARRVIIWTWMTRSVPGSNRHAMIGRSHGRDFTRRPAKKVAIGAFDPFR